MVILKAGVTSTVTVLDKRQFFEVVVNEISSIAKSLPGNEILVLIICILAVVAVPEFQVPNILVQPGLPAFVATDTGSVICTPFIKTLNFAGRVDTAFCAKNSKV